MNLPLFSKKYNNPQSVITISSYPGQRDKSIKNLNAVAAYFSRLAPSLNSHLNTKGGKLIILAEKLKGEESFYEENGVLVVRCWTRNHPLYIFQLLFTAIKFSRVNKIFIQFEFNMFGKIFATGLLPLLLLLLRVFGKNTTILLHQVVDDLSSLGGHINLRKGSLKSGVLNNALRLFYTLTALFSSKIIVHENVLKERLKKVTHKPISVIPIGLGWFGEPYSNEGARKHLSIGDDTFVLLCFGFITWYKGSDWIVQETQKYLLSHPDANILLLLAGGESANLKDQAHYKEYYKNILEMVQNDTRIRLTGFVDDADVPYYFSVADIVLLPYRTQMSASGPLAVALEYEKPFLISSNISETLDAEDFEEALKHLNLSKQAVTFEMDNNTLFTKIDGLISRPETLERLKKLSAFVRKNRLWANVSKKFIDIIQS
ncbi:MAG: glycosyl transferase family 2 [uncultured bacterium]|nr:MAG: glycosyl transferase family 2 [uncultured bacterium]